MRRVILILMGAFATTLIFSPGTASSSVLCAVNETPCSAENLIESGANVSLFSESTPGLPKCEAPHSLQLTDLGGEGKPVKAKISTVEMLTDCDPKGFWNCGTQGGVYNAQFEGSGGSGVMVLSPLHIKAWCTLNPWECTTISSESTTLEFTGGFPALASGTISGTPCSRTIQYTMYGPGGLYLVGGPLPGPVTRICKVNSSPCPLANRHPIGSSFEGSLEGNSTFEFLYEGKIREPTCEGGTLTGKTTTAGKPLIGEVSAMSFSKCGAGVCAVQAQSLAYKAEIEKTSGGNGTLALVSGAGGGPPKLEVNCGAAYKCTYKATSVSFALTGSGTTPKLAVSQTLEKDASSEAECGSTMTWKATYKLTKPTALYVTS